LKCRLKLWTENPEAAFHSAEDALSLSWTPAVFKTKERDVVLASGVPGEAAMAAGSWLATSQQ
jgi:hypothetical protein